MIFLAVFIYLLTTILLTFIGVVKQNEFLKIFLISLLLTPFVAGAYIFFRKKNYVKIQYYYCSACKYIFPLKMKHCPICEEEDAKVKLLKYKSPYKIAEQIHYTSSIY